MVKKFSCLVYYNARKLRIKPHSLELSLELRVRHFYLILLAYQILLRQQFWGANKLKVFFHLYRIIFTDFFCNFRYYFCKFPNLLIITIVVLICIHITVFYGSSYDFKQCFARFFSIWWSLMSGSACSTAWMFKQYDLKCKPKMQKFKTKEKIVLVLWALWNVLSHDCDPSNHGENTASSFSALS